VPILLVHVSGREAIEQIPLGRRGAAQDTRDLSAVLFLTEDISPSRVSRAPNACAARRRATRNQDWCGKR